jgi:hypothetical protein
LDKCVRSQGEYFEGDWGTIVLSLLLFKKKYRLDTFRTPYVCQLPVARLQTHAIYQNDVCAAQPADEQVMPETCRGSWFSISWMKNVSRWFHYTDMPLCTVSKTFKFTITVAGNPQGHVKEDTYATLNILYTDILIAAPFLHKHFSLTLYKCIFCSKSTETWARQWIRQQKLNENGAGRWLSPSDDKWNEAWWLISVG